MFLCHFAMVFSDCLLKNVIFFWKMAKLFIFLNTGIYTAVKMQVEFWDLLEIEPTWLRLFKWAQVVKTNHVNSPWNPQMPNLKFQKTTSTTAWKFFSKKDQLLKHWLTNYWITSQNGTPWNYFLMLLVYEYFLMPVGLLFYNKGEKLG